MKLIGSRTPCSLSKRQRGMTLTESLLVLLVGALAAAIAYGGYRMATGNVKSDSQIKSTVQLIGSVKRTFGPGADFASATTANVISARLLSDDFKSSGAVINNAWGGTVAVAADVPATRFIVTLTSIPQDSCMDFAAGVNGAAMAMSIGAVVVKAIGADYNAASVATECAKGVATFAITAG